MGSALARALVSAVALGTVATLMSCASNVSTRMAASQAIDSALAGPQRSATHRARDQWRHPRETLLFFGLRPDMKVMEIWPDPSGWYTEVLAPVLRERGVYYAAVLDAAPGNAAQEKRVAEFRQKIANNPALYDKVVVTTLYTDGRDIAPPGSLDMIVTFRNIHNWMSRNSAPQTFAAMFRALKPGGVLGVVEHRGNASVPQDPQAKSGYVNEQYAIDMIQAQGFRLVAKSEVNANPRDTKDYEQGVWTLPPVYRLGDRDREKYTAIGESDRFTLKFVKPTKR